jgi:guanine nucleotide-binding protein subunit alpha
MEEAMTIFDTIVNSRWFTKTAIILFLNKVDLLKAKLTKSPIHKYFPNFAGNPESWKDVGNYFLKRLKKLNRNPDKNIYSFFTTATDTNLLRITMESVQLMLIRQGLESVTIL